MQPDDASALQDILLAAQRISSAVAALSLDAYLGDWLVRAAVERQLGIVGEACKRLSDDFRASHPQIRWRAFAGLRDVLVHAYDRIDDQQIWQIATEESIGLRAFVEEQLGEA